MIVNSMSGLASVLKDARVAKGMTQSDLADLVGVSRQWVAAAEKGAPNVRAGLMLTALTCVDMIVEVKADTSAEIMEELFGAD